MGEKLLRSGSGAASAASRPASAPAAGVQKKPDEAGGGSLSRAQIALNRHQARMDRIREKREERVGGKDTSS